MWKVYLNILFVIVLPILLIWAIVLGTFWLLHERAERIENVTPVLWDRALGIGEPINAVGENWFSMYGGGEGRDTIIGRNEYSLRVSTGGDGGWYGARNTLVTPMSNHALSFSVRATNWNEIDRLVIQLGTSPAFNNYYGINLKNYFSKPESGEWIDVVLEPADFAPVEGYLLWEDVTDISVRVVPVAGVATKVWFDNWRLIEKNSIPSVVSFTFDDGFDSVVTASDILNEYNYNATLFVIPEFLDTESYLTQADVDTLHDGGWEIAGHGKDNLTELAAPDVDTQLAAMYSYLDERQYRGRQHFAYPNGRYTLEVKSQVLEYFQTARTIDGFLQTSEYLYPGNVNAVTVSSSTPVTEILTLVKAAEEKNSWLILVWHDLSTNPEKDTEYSIENFNLIVDYIESLDIEVKPYGEALQMYLQTVPEEKSSTASKVIEQLLPRT